MALIELNFGREQTDEDPDSVEIPLDGETESSNASGRGRRLLGAVLLVALVAGAGYVAYRRRLARDDSEFAEIVIDDEAAETVESSEE